MIITVLVIIFTIILHINNYNYNVKNRYNTRVFGVFGINNYNYFYNFNVNY